MTALPITSPRSTSGNRQRAQFAERRGLADEKGERAYRLGRNERPLRQAVRGEGGHAERTGRVHQPGQEADGAAGQRQLPKPIRKRRTRSQRPAGIIARKKMPSAASSQRDGSTSKVRAPSAAAGMPGIE